MAGRPSTLAIRVTASTRAARRELERLNGALDGMARQATSAGRALGRVSAAAASGLGLLPITAAAGAAGVALGAFAAAAGPQMRDVAEATELYAQAQQEALTDTKKSAETMAEYHKRLKAMPRATRDVAEATVDLKDAYKAWSDELSDTTMPLFTEALKGAKAALPGFTPLVKAAAKALGPLIDHFREAAENGSIERFSRELAAFAGPSMRNVLQAVENLAVGFANLFLAFGSATAVSASQGLVDLTERFREWSRTAEQSEGFQQVVAVAQRMWEAFLKLLPAVLQLGAALLPVIDMFSKLVAWFADVIANTPEETLRGVALALGTVYAAVLLLRAAYIALNTTFLASPLGWIVLAIAAIAGALIWAYQESETFRRIVKEAMEAVRHAVDILKDAYKRNKKEIDQMIRAALKLAEYLGKFLVWAIIKTAEGLAMMIDVIARVTRWVSDLNDDIRRLARLLSAPFSLIINVSGLGAARRALDMLSFGASALSLGAPQASAYGLAARAPGAASGGLVRTLTMPLQVFITIDGQQLQGRIDRSINRGMNADGARLAAGGAF